MLEQVNFDEARQSQLPFIELLLNVGYKYISAEEVLKERGNSTSHFILADIAAKKLMEINGFEIDGAQYKFSEKDVRDAIDELENIQYEGLIDTAQKIYNIIMPTSGGKTIKINHRGKKMSQNFRFIDFEKPENNVFHVTAEYVATGKQNIRPDIVVFINGIPFSIIENKKSGVSAEDAINQMNRNQGPEYCPRLYTYAQLLVGANSKEFKYGTTGTQGKFYSIWRERDRSTTEFDEQIQELIRKPIDIDIYDSVLTDLNGATKDHKQKTGRLPTEQDRGVVSLFTPDRLLDITKNYTLFDAGEKKLARYQQFFAINKMRERISEKETTEAGITRRRGGLIWHTQGSGKSLTMVMFVKALIEDPNITNPRVIIVTDRRDLDRQIKTTFINCNLKKDVIQASSGQHLIDLVREKNLSVITTLVHKFEAAKKKNPGFTDTDSNIFVLVDEAHRSQAGMANLEMNRMIPNACYIGFTGTPLMKTEKESWRKFGDYIDKYTIDDALEDKIILPLIYEGRYVDLSQNKEQMDKHFNRVTEDVSEYGKRELQKEIKKRIIKDNPGRITEITYDIEKHYTDLFQGTGLKAQIVAPSKYSAVLFQKNFEEQGKIKTAMVISDEHEDGEVDDARKNKVIEYLKEVREYHGSISKYEKDAIDSFKHNDEGIEILIVVDKLLTGFDAPRNTVLYLAKDLKDHNLLQAIARVNRLYENDSLPKTAGYIIDYSENALNIKTAMELFGNFDEEDVSGTLIDVGAKIQELEDSYSSLHDIFKTIKSDDDEEYLQYLGDKQRRDSFYKTLNEFIKKMSECYALQDFVHQFEDLKAYKRELKKFMELRNTASLRYADREDLTKYKHALIKVLDKYVDASGVEILTEQVDIFSDREKFEAGIEKIGSTKSKAEAIGAQMEKSISEKMVHDPEYYKRFSLKIEEILQKMREDKLADAEALEQLKMVQDEVAVKKDTGLPKKISENKGSDILYRNMRKEFSALELDDEDFIKTIVDLSKVIKRDAIVDWHKNSDVKRQIANNIDDYLYDELKVGKGLDISTENIRRIVDKAIELANHNTDVFSK